MLGWSKDEEQDNEGVEGGQPFAPFVPRHLQGRVLVGLRLRQGIAYILSSLWPFVYMSVVISHKIYVVHQGVKLRCALLLYLIEFMLEFAVCH